MNICILGWYGTETLGDRAILDGIVHIFTTIEANIKISIGSLYPIVTERTIFEDIDFYRSHADSVEVKQFDVKDKKALHMTIRQADIVIMGGGPLMDLVELFIIQHAFKYAKKYGKVTALIGCGYGPLSRKEYIKCVHDIIRFSDLVIMRSESCREQILRLCEDEDKHKVYTSKDPAEISVIEYRKRCIPNAYLSEQMNTDPDWIMNIRDLDYVYGTKDHYYPMVKKLVRKIAEQVPRLCLMPMHSFSIGGDDRYIQNMIAQDLDLKNLFVMEKPLSLQECYDKVRNAAGCIGMRYHSIVFQTYLNGNNYLIDYTDPKVGKISAFLAMIDHQHFYTDRYINILNESGMDLSIMNTCNRFSYDDSDEQNSLLLYKELLEKAMDGSK